MEIWEAAYIAGIIDGEGSITLTRMHSKEHRRPCISISSNDKEMLIYIQNLAGGSIYNKKNYNPNKHKNSYTLYIKKKNEVFHILKEIHQFLRIDQKKKRAEWILTHYDSVTPRNGKYNKQMISEKLLFERNFFEL
ncbi:LAGLIDADG family homing endonuclease [Virgibacillus sp. FSP13]